MDSRAQESVAPSRQPACDACRKRKIRCDKTSPCSSCKASDLLCQTTCATPGRRQRRQLISRREQTIASLEAKVELLSKSLTPRSEATNGIISRAEGPSPSAAAITPSSTPSYPQNTLPDRDGGFEGDSSFMMHSKQATQAFKASFAATPQLNVDDALSDAVTTLQKVLDSNTTLSPSAPCSRDSSWDEEDHGLSTLPLPPSDLVLKLLKRAKVESQRLFDDVPALDLNTVISCCQKVFFAMEPFSIATFIIVNTSLLYLLHALTNQAKLDFNVSHGDLIHYVNILPKNVDFALRKMPLVASPSVENILALHLASCLAVESSIEAPPWDLISNAARMAMNAGYHRLKSRSGDAEAQLKIAAFWSIYAMDRSMALSLGRAPTIQDYDIQTDLPATPEDIDSPAGPLLANWVDVAKLQGDIYYQLYSPHAQNQPPDTKVASAKHLAERCSELHKGFQVYSNYYNDFYEGLQILEIGFQSLLAMIYRMIPAINANHPLQFSRECILSARAALKLHNQGWFEGGTTGKISDNDWRSFIHWSTLFSPFVPFICIFGNVISQSDLQDLALLSDFVSTLRSAAEQSHMVKKLHYACNSFHEIAKVYLARKSKHPPPCGIDADNNGGREWQSIDGDGGEAAFQQLSDALLSQQDWDLMLSDWDLGLGTLEARQMSSYLDLLPNA